MIDLGSAAALLGTLGIGSVVGQYLSDAKDRRTARAEVLHALSVVESARWAPRLEGEPSFRDASRQLQTAALIARVPRRLLVEYLTLAQAAAWLSAESWRESGGDEYGNGIDGYLGDSVRFGAQGLADLIWAPLLQRRFVERRGLRRVRQSLLTIENKSTLREIAHSRNQGVS